MKLPKKTTNEEAFWSGVDSLVATKAVIVDRPAGSTHPRWPEYVYPLDYGYLDGTTAMDGGGIDVWLGTLPERIVTALVCTVDLLKHDIEPKILIGCSPVEFELIADFFDKMRLAHVVVRRSTPDARA